MLICIVCRQFLRCSIHQCTGILCSMTWIGLLVLKLRACGDVFQGCCH